MIPVTHRWILPFVDTKPRYTNWIREILNAVNYHRKSIGLTVHEKLDGITIEAVDHTKYMVSLNVVNHHNFNI